jgi:hypothetical protein
MQLPGRIPSRLLLNLPEIRLPRPIRSRLELLVAFSYYDQTFRFNDHIFLHATATRIRAAMQVVERELRTRLTARRAEYIQRFVDYVAQFPEVHRGNIVGLARKAVRWRRSRVAEVRESILRRYGETQRFGQPPIRCPEHRNIYFLDTVGVLFDEGERMNHCVAELIPAAIRSDSYFFHVQYRDEEATVQVGRSGRVIQSQGPYNQQNITSRWGKAVLDRWGRRFPTARQPPPPVSQAVPF